MGPNLLDGRLGDILSTILTEGSGDVYVVHPTRETIEELVNVAGDHDGDVPTIHLLADDRNLREVMDDFLVASNAADLVHEGTLELRSSEDSAGQSLVVTEESVVALVSAGTRTGGLRTDDDAFVEKARDAYAAEWEAAETYRLRTPPISRVRDTLSSDMGPEAEEDFSEVLASLETARGDGDGLDEVTISLLVAAKNEELFYDISRWGEDVGVASKATFSRMKNRLEDSGLIGTEKVPVDVGRPRQRLTIQDDRLREADSTQLASVAETILN
ncbi:hypothetical protein BRD00_12265 [Halobacteriales archaeon QS_8_69_26]|nr:MAG: hypothetical protein BRD00_12265 [Halobacteriales archaeon QS_8_69_26]